jgi:hypothetical protein
LGARMAEYILDGKKLRKPIPVAGEKFNYWTLIEFTGWIRTTQRWKCMCKCGVTRDGISMNDLRTGKSKSCGCIMLETHFTHGMANTSEYKIWAGMIQRCTNPLNDAYKNYGTRGITVCDRWLNSFENFYADMGRRPSKEMTIDRIDNDKGYYPDNCKWSDKFEQNQNKRETLFVFIDGARRSLSDECRKRGFNYGTAFSRFKRGLPIDEIFKMEDSRYRKNTLHTLPQ